MNKEMTNKEVIEILKLLFEQCKGTNECLGYIEHYFSKDEETALDLAIKALEERPQGKWIKEDDEHLKGWYRCSECGRRVEDLTDDIVIHAGCEDYTVADIYPYCHCGADMRGKKND